MSITSNISQDGSNLTITIEGNFDANIEDEFRISYEGDPDVTPNSYTINMEKTEYLDSAALGMLLVFKDYAGGDSSDITITNCSREVKKILSVSGFDSLFKLQ